MRGRVNTQPTPPVGPAPSSISQPRVNLSASVPQSENNPRIGIVIANGVGSDLVLDETIKALRNAGYSDISTVQVADSMMLPYSAQTMFQQFHLVAIQASQPVVSGVFCPSSLLEARVLLPELTKKWTETASGFMASKYGYVPTPPPSAAPAAVTINPSVRSTNLLLEDFRQTLKNRGTTEIFQLGKKFAIIDDDQSGTLDLQEFTKCMREHRLTWTNEQIKLVFDLFDDDRTGTITYEEFLFHVRGEMNDRRKQMALMAFEVLDTDKSGIVDLNDIRGVYNTSKHPDVISGKKTSDQVLTEFLYTFNHGRDGVVTPLDFIDYYNHVSCSIDNDDYFELMIRNAWHISGGHGWCENTTCRRVLVTHTDGRQTVEEIKNDIGLDKDDREGMMQRLRRQGIDDLVSIDLFGSSDSTTPATNPGGGPASSGGARGATGRGSMEVETRPAMGTGAGYGETTAKASNEYSPRPGRRYDAKGNRSNFTLG